MGIIYNTFTKTKKDNTPMVISIGDQSVHVAVDWAKTTSQNVTIITKAEKNVDILLPTTFIKLKHKIDELEKRLKEVIDEHTKN